MYYCTVHVCTLGFDSFLAGLLNECWSNLHATYTDSLAVLWYVGVVVVTMGASW